MRNPHFQHPPISLKLEGNDSSEKTPWVTVGRVGSTVRGLVGTWRYDVCQTVAFPDYGARPKLEDLIALAELAHERDCTRGAFPVTLFFALKTLFNGTCSSKGKPRSRKAAILASLDIADEAKSAVIDAFPARQRRMEEQIERYCYRIVTLYQEVDPQTHGPNSAMDLQDALAEVAILQETVTQLTAILDADANAWGFRQWRHIFPSYAPQFMYCFNRNTPSLLLIYGPWRTPYNWALLHPRLVCRLLLENGAEVSATGGKYGTALQAASIQGHVESVQLLLQYGADVNTAGGVYGSALQAASAKGYAEVVCLLLEHGAEVNAAGGTYGSALQAASRNDHIDAVQRQRSGWSA
ncbi:hypothetical protein B0H14DRAFT_3504649 [Mycena olivaceomarginata]|nr:hypothetical protein B0H14DRAFT_3504649 [Mycena olivaceomarginata]